MMKKRRIDDAFFLLAIDRRRALPFPASSLLFCTPRLPGRFEHVEKSAPKWGKMRRKRGVRGRERERESSTSTTTPFSLNLLSPTPTPTPPPTSESLTLRDLTDCSVYVLDHSSEVEASNCKNCQLFVGPVDGAAIFDACDGCTVAVASQQFQARKCSDTEFGVYCATAPTVRNCKGVRVGCWVSKRGGGRFRFFLFSFSGFFSFFLFFSKTLKTLTFFFLPSQNLLLQPTQVGAYPGLTRHFAAANLDPGSNQWRKVHDATPAEEKEGGGEGGDGTAAKAPFEIVESSPSWWEVPIEGGDESASSSAAPPDNPVPAADGALYSPPAAAAAASEGGGEEAASAAASAPASAAAARAPFGSGLTPAPSAEIDPLAAPSENGGGAGGPPADNGAPSSTTTNPAAAQAARAARERLSEQEEAERAARADAQAKAAAFLSEFYARRDAAASARPKPATAATPEGGGGPSGATPWERVLSLLDLDSAPAAAAGGSASSARSSGAGGVSAAPADLSRFKAAMFTAKAKGLGL